jgi:uncharacterized delta-60 repeat protein
MSKQNFPKVVPTASRACFPDCGAFRRREASGEYRAETYTSEFAISRRSTCYAQATFATYQVVSVMTARFRLSTSFLALLLLTAGVAAVRGQNALDGFDPHANGAIQAIAVQKDGKILIGGDFTTITPNNQVTIGRNHIARLNPDGTVDAGFNPNANHTVRAIVIQSDGKILIGGDFTVLNSTPRVVRNHIARLNPVSGVVDQFDPNANDIVRAIAVQPDDKKVLAGGDFTTLSPDGGAAVGRDRLARVNPDGTLDGSLTAKANGSVRALVAQKGGKILAGGAFTSIGEQTRNRIARLNTDGSADPSLNSNADNEVDAIVVQTDGKIVVGGAFTSIGGQPRNRLARLNVEGAADAFNPNANDQVLSIVLQSDGEIAVGGAFTTMAGIIHNRLARLNADGTLDTIFAPSANSTVFAMAQQQDAKIVVGGNFTQIGGPTRDFIARLEIDGRLDQILLPDSIGAFEVLATAIQPDGKILIGGIFDIFGTTHLLRLNTDGTVEAAFNAGSNDPDGQVTAIAVQGDGRIVVGGAFTTFSGMAIPRNHILRLNRDGSLDTGFDPNADGDVLAIAVQTNNQIVIGGNFTMLSPNGGASTLRSGIARLKQDGTVDMNFNPGADNNLDAIALERNGNILVGGFFHHIGGVARNFIARLSPAGVVDSSFDPNAMGVTIPVNPPVFLCVQQDDKILVAGDFTNIGGAARHNIARLDTTGHADSFNPNATGQTNDGQVLSIALQADRKILVGGFFTNIGGQPRSCIARLDPDTGMADSFDPKALSGGHPLVNSIVVQADGKILAGGFFSNIGGQPRQGLARLTNDTAALQTLTATSNTITLTRAGSSPRFSRVLFESSTDNVNFTALGEGMPSGSDWKLSGLNLPTGQNLIFRARGHSNSGQAGRCESILGTRQSAFFPGTFVIGDGNAAVGRRVIFWGPQWSRGNSLSGGPAPANFEGFANSASPNPPACGGSWSSNLRDGSAPPPTVPAEINVIVASSITESGNIISGNIPEMAVVETDRGYDPNRGHPGTGTVVSVSCTR